jgi:hypothetical protein
MELPGGPIGKSLDIHHMDDIVVLTDAGKIQTYPRSSTSLGQDCNNPVQHRSVSFPDLHVPQQSRGFAKYIDSRLPRLCKTVCTNAGGIVSPLYQEAQVFLFNRRILFQFFSSGKRDSIDRRSQRTPESE